MTQEQEFKVGGKVRYKADQEEACKNNGHEFGKVYTIKSIFEFDTLRCAYVFFDETDTLAFTFRLEHVDLDHDVIELMTRRQLIEKLQEVSLDRYELYSKTLRDQWYNSNTLLSYEKYLANHEKEKLDRFEQEMLQFNQLQ